MKKIIDGEELEIPTHVAIIMDGNGRWAKKRLLPRNMGHRQGAKVLEQICRDAADLGIRYLTVYAFSTENWKRSTEEVTGIMNLLRSYLSNCVERASKDGLRIRVIGDRSALDADIVEMLEHAERETAKFDKLDFTIALNYGGRDELRRTMTKLAKQVQEGTLAPEAITEDVIAKHLDTADLPDPDLHTRCNHFHLLPVRPTRIPVPGDSQIPVLLYHFALLCRNSDKILHHHLISYHSLDTTFFYLILFHHDFAEVLLSFFHYKSFAIHLFSGKFCINVCHLFTIYRYTALLNCTASLRF